MKSQNVLNFRTWFKHSLREKLNLAWYKLNFSQILQKRKTFLLWNILDSDHHCKYDQVTTMYFSLSICYILCESVVSHTLPMSNSSSLKQQNKTHHLYFKYLHSYLEQYFLWDLWIFCTQCPCTCGIKSAWSLPTWVDKRVVGWGRLSEIDYIEASLSFAISNS